MKNQNKDLQHLLWRAGFGATVQNLQAYENKPLTQVVDDLFAKSKKVVPLKIVDTKPLSFKRRRMMSREERRAMRRKSRKQIKQLNLRWIERMVEGDGMLREKMTFFWHGHFACQSRNVHFMQNQLNTISTHALGSFRDLLMAIAKDPAMLFFLNNQQNKKQQPNENFARELMELFTLGRGNYTEKDIKEAARAFTGWSVNRSKAEYRFKQHQHDTGNKIFFGKTGSFSGEDIINIILQQEQTAKFITEKVFRFFVNDVPDKQVINRLAREFYQSDYSIETLMRSIFASRWFYKDEHIGSKIKSPVEFLVGIRRNFQIDFIKRNSALFIQKILGQILMYPPNVAGWSGGRSWIDSSTLMFRLKLPYLIFRVADIDITAKAEGDMNKQGFVNRRMRRLDANIRWHSYMQHFSKLGDKKQTYKALSAFLLQASSPKNQQFVDRFTNVTNQEDLIKAMSLGIASLPEYQMC